MRQALVLVLVTAGCIPNLPISDALLVACETDADCPRRMACVEELERCVIDDGVPPRLLSVEIDYRLGNDPTDVVRPGGFCEVQVVADKALDERSTVVLDCPDQSRTERAITDPRSPTVVDFSILWSCVNATQYVCTVSVELVGLTGSEQQPVAVDEVVIVDCATP